MSEKRLSHALLLSLQQEKSVSVALLRDRAISSRHGNVKRDKSAAELSRSKR